jgi:hypothetical protein
LLPPRVWILSRLSPRHPQRSATFRLLWPRSCRNLTQLTYECLLQWQQNRSKAMMWLLYKVPAIWVCPRRS